MIAREAYTDRRHRICARHYREQPVPMGPIEDSRHPTGDCQYCAACVGDTVSIDLDGCAVRVIDEPTEPER